MTVEDTRTPSIGLLGGMGWASTELYYTEICKRDNRDRGGLSLPEVQIHSFDFERMHRWAAAGAWDEVTASFVTATRHLARGGAQAIAVACNTMHMVIDQLAQNVDVPVVNMVDVVLDEMKRRGLHRCRLVGTESTLTNGFFQRAATRRGLSLSEPGAADAAALDEIIFSELTKGVVSPAGTRVIERQLVDAFASGEGLVLACTELGLLLSPEQRSDQRIVDSAETHIAAIVGHLLGTRESPLSP